MADLREDVKILSSFRKHFQEGEVMKTQIVDLGDHLESPIYAEMYDLERKKRREEKVLVIFGILLSGLGWFGTGYQLSGLLMGLGMGLGSILVMAMCVLKIENGGK